MANACKLIPTVKVVKDGKEKEVDSILFPRLQRIFGGDRSMAKKVWAWTKTRTFNRKYGNKVRYDENGEPTLTSMINLAGDQAKQIYKDKKQADDVARDYDVYDKTFADGTTAISKVNEINANEERFTAYVEDDPNVLAEYPESPEGSYRVTVGVRNYANVEHARTQAYNHALTMEIIDLLKELGLNVEFLTNAEYDGLFDPRHAEMKEGLLTIIRIVKGELGEKALPEEFAHAMIEGLIRHPLVQRLLDSIDDDTVREVLGDQYEQYADKYDNDSYLLQKETAGKLLAEYIIKKGTIKRSTVNERKTLLSRIWQWIKNLFGKITQEKILSMENKASDAVADIYNLIKSSDIVDIFSKEDMLNGDNLYSLSGKMSSLQSMAEESLHLSEKIRKMEFGDKEKTKQNTQNLQQQIHNIEADKFYSSVYLALDEVTQHLNDINEDINDLKAALDKLNQHSLTEIKTINNIAKVARKADMLIQGYKDFIDTIANIDKEDAAELGITEDQTEKIADKALKLERVLNQLIQWKGTVSRNILFNAARTIFKDDSRRTFGSEQDKEYVASLETILEHGDRDISVMDRYISAMSSNSDTFSNIMEGIAKQQWYERDIEVNEVKTKIAYIDKKLRDAGYKSDFIYERDKDGIPTGRIISEYDWDGFNADKKKVIEQLRKMLSDKKITWEQYKNRLNTWKNGREKGKPRLIRVYVDPKVDKLYREKGWSAVRTAYPSAIYEMAPNPEVYSKNKDRITSLPAAQQEYYKAMMDIKRELMCKIPHRGQGIFKTIYISKDIGEAVTDGTIDNRGKAVMEHYKKKFLRRPDDLGFGISDDFEDEVKDILKRHPDQEYEAAKEIIAQLDEEVDEDVVALVSPRKLARVIRRNKGDINKAAADVMQELADVDVYFIETDFADNPIERLPIYYTRRLKDMRMLSTDFSGSLVAYSAMAINYEKMDEIVDILEIARTYLGQRKVIAQENGHSLMARSSALGHRFTQYVMSGTAQQHIFERYQEWMESAIYEKRKKKEGSVKIPFTDLELDVAKTTDAIKDYTGLLSLGFNIFSAVSNVTVGKLQQWFEAYAGEFFTVKEYAKAVTLYSKLLPGHLAEMNSPIKKNKLSLLIEMFDPMGEYFESLRDPSFSKSTVSRILGNGLLGYLGLNAGEHLLHCQTMLAMLIHTKLVEESTGKEISLLDALEVKEVDGITKLVLKDGLIYRHYTRDFTGTVKSNKNYGKALKDKNGNYVMTDNKLKDLRDNYTQRYIIRVKRKIRKVNDTLNGAFNANDKGPIQRRAIGRLIIQFRQWMPAHYARRFASAHYDNDLDMWREGFYRTFWRVSIEMIKEIRHAEFNYMNLKSSLTNEEKDNLKRAIGEIVMYVLLTVLVRLGGRVKDKERSWLNKMILYQLNRMKLETGASMPFNSGFFANIFSLLNSPMASINTFENLASVLKFWTWSDEIESGRYEGWTIFERNAFKLTPMLPQTWKALDFDDSMFTMFEDTDK